MSAPISFASTEVPYPIFDAEFDPFNRGYIVIGGGGGENRNNVPNRITLLDVSSRTSIHKAAEIDLSTAEDSVQSLACLTTKTGLVALAGINSSSADLEAGKNEHFRSFIVDFPIKSKTKQDAEAKEKAASESTGKIEFAGKTAIFKAPRSGVKTQTYQRLIRLSPPVRATSDGKRIGAIATAWGQPNEIVLFNAATTLPAKDSVCARISLDEGSEAEDIDLLEPKDGKFELAYCTESDVYLYSLHFDGSNLSSDPKITGPTLVFSLPKPTTSSPKAKLRSLRWLSPHHILLMHNLPSSRGAELSILTIDSPSSAYISLRKRLPSSIKSAINRGLTICSLDSDAGTGERQIVVAVAGIDRSIHILTLSHVASVKQPGKQITAFNSVSVLHDVHANSISKITFSNFYPPRQNSTSTMSVAVSAQYIRLASVSVANTVVVDTLALTSVPAKPSTTPEAASKPDDERPNIRWVLSTSGTEWLRSWAGLIVIALVVLVFAMSLQAYLNAGPDSPSAGFSLMPGRNILPRLSNTLSKTQDPIVVASSQASNAVSSAWNSASSGISTVSASASASATALASSARLVDILSSLKSPSLSASDATSSTDSSIDKTNTNSDSNLNLDPHPVILIRPHDSHPTSISLSTHTLNIEQNPSDNNNENEKEHSTSHHNPDLKAANAKKFEDLPPSDQKRWKKRLADAGHWAESEGEAVLKGVFFSEWAAVVGGAVRDAILD